MYAKKNDKDKLIIAAMIYLSSFEMLARMAKTTPFIPYEVSKYILTFFLILGVFNKPIKTSKGWWMLVLIMPAMFYDLSGEAWGYMPIVFNAFGPLDIALAIIYFSRLTVTNEELAKYIRLLFWAIFTSVIFTIIKTPTYDELEFTLSANFNTSGGFGSNQVSTVFGVGFFIMFIAWFQDWRLSGEKILDALLMVLFLFQAIMTFSRGGVIGGLLAIGIIVILIIINKANEAKTKNLTLAKYLVLFSIIVFFIFTIADGITGGVLTNRYKGETASTLDGTKEQTFNNMTSNRFDIFIGDLELWEQNPILGVGVGASKFLRKKGGQIVAHIELSRLLSEHGILGVVYFLLLISVGLDIFKNNIKLKIFNGYFLAGLFAVAFFTTFHAATRTFISPLLFGLSVLTLKENKKCIK